MYDELTKNDIKKMEEEIEYRKLVVRKEAIEAVKEARAQGDLSENFEYYAAKKDPGGPGGLPFSQGEAWPSEAPPPAARGVYGVCHGLFAAFSQMIMTTILAQTGESTTDFARFPKIFII